jgi:hypothetical protein
MERVERILRGKWRTYIRGRMDDKRTSKLVGKKRVEAAKLEPRRWAGDVTGS